MRRKNNRFWQPARQVINYVVVFLSVLVCCFLLLTRIPGMTILGISPQWLLIWLVAWSVKRDLWSAAIAAVGLGWLHDALTMGSPSHVPGLLLVALLTANLQKQRYLQEDFISLAIIVFMMTFLAETVMALQYLFLGLRPLGEVWLENQKIALTSAILSSLWAPVICYPLVRWWDQLRTLDRQ